MEQVLISATTSAEAATAILSRAQRDAGQQNLYNEHGKKHKAGGHGKYKDRRKVRLEWLDLVTSNKGRRLETHMEAQFEQIDLDSLTSLERRLVARYRNIDTTDDDDATLTRPSSMPTESFLSRPPHELLARQRPAPSGGGATPPDVDSDTGPPVVLEGGSYAMPFVPSDRSSTTHSSAPSSPSAGGAHHPHVPGGWVLPKSATGAAGGLKHAIRDADEAAQVSCAPGIPARPRLHRRSHRPSLHPSAEGWTQTTQDSEGWGEGGAEKVGEGDGGRCG